MSKMVVGLVSVLVVIVLLGCVLVPTINNIDLESRTTITLDNTGTPVIGGNIGDQYTFNLEGQMITKVIANTTTTWVLTKDGKLFGCGYNSNGQQGDGTTTDVKTFTQRLEGETVKDISAAPSETWAVTTDGKLFGCGANNSGQQGDGTTTDVKTFTQRLTTETIDSVHTSGGSTFAVTTDGKLFGCGNAGSGQQGSGTTTNVTTFTQRLEGENVKTVTTGQTTWVLTKDGKLFGCGRNSSGNQGDGTTTDVKTFTQRLTTETIGSFVGGDSVTWAVTTDGKLFGCGSGFGGQQGDGNTTAVTSFTQRLTTETISSVAAGSSTTWAVTTDGKLFGCGYNSNGQQGDGTTNNVTSFTQRLDEGGLTHSFYKGDTEIPLSGISKDGYTFLVGGNDWVITLEGSDYVLYYSGLSDKDVLSGVMSLIFSNGTMTVDGELSSTFTYTTLFYEGNGNYVMMEDPVYAATDTKILGFAFPTGDSGIAVSGTYSSPSAASIADGSITVGSGSVTTEATEYEGAVKVSAVSATYDTDQTADCSFVIVPNKVMITETTAGNPAIESLLSAIPLIVIASLIVAMAAIMIYRRE